MQHPTTPSEATASSFPGRAGPMIGGRQRIPPRPSRWFAVPAPVLLLAVAALLLLPRHAAAPPKVHGIVSTSTAEFSGIVHDFVTNEDVELEGSIHILTRVTIQSDLSFLIALHANIFNVQGIGLTSGLRYTATGADLLELVAPAPDSDGFTGTRGQMSVEYYPNDIDAPRPNSTLTLEIELRFAETGQLLGVSVTEVAARVP